jgi:hypothetical protein
MMNLEQWKEGLKAWQNVKKQAEIDLEQSELYLSVISKKIEELESSLEVENGK